MRWFLCALCGRRRQAFPRLHSGSVNRVDAKQAKPISGQVPPRKVDGATEATVNGTNQAGNYPHESVGKPSLFNNLSNLRLYIEVWISLVIDVTRRTTRCIGGVAWLGGTSVKFQRESIILHYFPAEGRYEPFLIQLMVAKFAFPYPS
jgi:hypothetical protein